MLFIIYLLPTFLVSPLPSPYSDHQLLLEKAFGFSWSSGSMTLERLWGDTLCPRAKEKPQEDGRRGGIAFRVKPHSCQRCSDGSNIPCAQQDTETPQRPPELCLSVSCGGTRQQWTASGTGALGAIDLGMAQALLEEVTINPTIELPELTQDWGNRLLEGTNRNLCAPGPRRKEQWPHKRWTQTCPWVTRSLQKSCGLAVACCRAGGTECSSAGMGPSEGDHHYLLYLHCSLASGQINGREHRPAHQHKIRLKIYWAWPRPSEQDSVSPSVNLSQQEASISLLSLSIRGQTERKPESQKSKQCDHIDHNLV